MYTDKKERVAPVKLKEFARKSFLKPWDIVIILFLILLSFTPIVIFGVQQSQIQASDEVTYQAVLKVDGEEIRRFDLVSEQEGYTYRYEDPDGDYNLIEILGNRIRIAEASCLDQLCVRQGWIYRSGQTIVCLPHTLVIEIEASDGSEDGGMIY